MLDAFSLYSNLNQTEPYMVRNTTIFNICIKVFVLVLKGFLLSKSEVYLKPINTLNLTM